MGFLGVFEHSHRSAECPKSGFEDGTPLKNGLNNKMDTKSIKKCRKMFDDEFVCMYN